MQLHKTELARALLARTGPELGQAQRRVLILCDGKRSLETIVKMLGTEALGQIDGLIRSGFLSTGLAPAPVAASPAPAPPPPPVQPATLANPTPRASRRSMAASKMYMIDMLQLQRDMQASSIAVALQTSREDGDLIEAFAGGLAFLHASTKSTVSSRVAERLLETIPEEHLQFMQGVWARLEGNAPDAANVIRFDARESRVA